MKKLLTFVLLLASASAFADEGMWMPQQVPQLAEHLKKMGLKLDPNQLSDLTGFPMNAIVSTGGCSASFVSPQGLIVTNHHCVYGYLQYNSSAEKNLIAQGFLAKTMAEEPQASPDARVFVTTAIEDVTTKILDGLEKKKMTDVDRFKTIDRRVKEMVSECEKPGGVRCRIASFFEGTQFLKTTQMEIRDVRLVYAPPDGIGTFGGETDNWMWPRHTGDFGYIRAYVGKDGKPADFSKDNVPFQPKHYLKVATGDFDPGDLMMVIGYPGTTFRYKTAAETRNAQEFEYPTSIRYRRDLIAILDAQGAKDKGVAIKNATRIRGLANYLKKYEGTLEGFKKGDLVGRRVEEEAKLATLHAND
ncbi:MAG TPA: S46 family peptidase, partial [Thermoanaerobaculia bacterium]